MNKEYIKIVSIVILFVGVCLGVVLMTQPLVNGLESKDILIGDDTVIVIGEVRYGGYGSFHDSGLGDVYVITKSPRMDQRLLVYNDVQWTLVTSRSGWLLYVDDAY